MIVLLVGPSGTGKSQALDRIEPLLSPAVCCHLDRWAPEWAARHGIVVPDSGVNDLRSTLKLPGGDDTAFLVAGLAAIGWLATDNLGKDLIVDVGSGFLHAPAASDLHRHFTIVFFHAEARTAFARLAMREPSFTPCEYSQAIAEAHCAAYETAHFRIDTTHLDLGQTADVLAQILSAILAKP